MTLFLSTYENKIDKKGRVSVPASFRAALSSESFQGFVAFRSYKVRAIECCSFSRMQKLSESLDELDLFSDTQDDLAATIFADALQIPFDSDGRIILPKQLADYAGIIEKAAFVGRGSTFQIWDPEAFKNIQQQARQNVKDKQTTLKLRTPLSPKGGQSA
jgi:MraZ protein